MKLRVLKSHMNKALMWYTMQLQEKHMGQFLTPATIELILRDLESLQGQMQKRESNSVWKVPVGLSYDLSRNNFEVVVTDESNVLYLHEEKR